MKLTPQLKGIIYFAVVLFSLLQTTLLAQEVDTIVDIRDGQRYRVVKIGNQWWTAENLKAAKYLNNDPIPTGHSDSEWGALSTGAYAIYPHSQIDGLATEAEVLEAYGALYNWYAVDDDRGLCPVGWKVPTNGELTKLVDYVEAQGYSNSVFGGEAGNALKSCMQVDSPLGGECATNIHPRWNSDATHYGTDVFNFSALPGGIRSEYYGTFNSLGYYGYWWSSTESDATLASYWGMGYDFGELRSYHFNKRYGISVRCVRDIGLFGSLTYLIISCENFENVESIYFNGESGSEKFFLINQGTQDVTISNISFSLPQYSIDITPTTIAAGDSIHFTISYNTEESGAFDDYLTIDSDDPFKPTIKIPIYAYNNATTACGVISENTTWTKANSPYYLEDCNVAVGAGVTLTIEPGVTVIIDPTRQISVDGTLIANGTEGDSITFRDTDGNGFSRLYFRSGSNVEMSFFKISGAETAIRSESNTISLSHGRITDCTTGVSLSLATASIDYLKIIDCFGKAIYADATELSVNNSTFNSNESGVYAINSSYGLITNSSFSLNYSTVDDSGIYLLSSSSFVIRDNTFTNNVGSPLYIINNAHKEISGNSFTNNAQMLSFNNVLFSNNLVEEGTAGGLFAQNSTLNINILRNNGGYGINAINSILSDNEVTGNTGNGINADNCTLTNNIVTNNGGIGINATNFNEITYSTISGNTGEGIRDQGGSNIQHCDIIDNGGDGIWTSALPTVNYSNIHGNTGYNFRATKEGSETIDATNNYWGTTVSAEIAAKIWDYYDDGVSVKVDYTPFAEGTVRYPRIIGTSVAGITRTAATITAILNPNTLETSVYIEYGLSSEYGTTVATQPATLTGSDNQTATLQLSDLTLGTRYHYRIKAVNASGTTYSETQIFTTAFYHITDIRDGQRYRVVKIGNQWWTAENLKAAKYLNNDPIPTGHSDSDWANLTTGAYAIYPHAYINLDSDVEVLEAYGALYNWFAVDNNRGLCPVGWKVPTDDEWTILTDNAGGAEVAGGKLKSTRTMPDDHPSWWNPNTGATDEYGFSAVPGGDRGSGGGVFYGAAGLGYWWSSTELDVTLARRRNMGFEDEDVHRGSSNKMYGFSLRCLRNIELFGQFTYLIISHENFEPASSLGFTNENASKKLYLINQGGEAVNISNVTTTIPEFSTDLAPTVLAAGDSIHFTVSFSIEQAGTFEDNLVIESDDPFAPTITIPLTGKASVVASTSVTDITTTSALVTASINPYGEATTITVDYGETEDYGQIAQTTPATVEGDEIQTVMAHLTDLEWGTKYYYRIKAENASGTSYSEPQTFTTAFHHITDIRDGQRYRVVKIGDQWWTAENLKAAKYLNNDPIPTGYSDNDWMNLTTGAYAVYPHSQIDGLNSDAEVLEAYGALYNWYTVDDSRGLCPVGWKMPSDEEWTTLRNYAGGVEDAGGKLKSTRITPDSHPRWNDPNEGATDAFGFSALPGGNRSYGDGYFYAVGYYGYWWSSTENDATYAWYLSMHYDNGNVHRDFSSKRIGFSVRCVRDIDLFGSFAYLIISDENFEPISSLEFTNENAAQKLYLINQGGEAVNITGVSLSTTKFSVDLTPTTLAAGDSIHFTVNFTATEYGVYEGNLQIESDDPFVSTINIALQGEMKYYSPVAVVQPATEVTYTSAKLNAKVNSYGEVAQVWFQYGLDEEDLANWQTVVATPGNISGTSEVGISANISGLLINTSYHFSVKVVNDYETVFSTTASFTTLAKAPTVTTQSVSNNSSTQATLNGRVNPHNSSTTVVFKYGITETITDDWLVVNYGETLNGYDAMQVSIDITGLSNQTQYYYLVEGTNSAGTSTGEAIGFNTSAPIVNLTAATEITTTSARLNATVNGNGYSSSYYFEYASNESLSDSQVTATQNLDAGTEAVAVSATIANLDPNTIFYFRIVAENTYGTSHSNPGDLHTLCDWDIICTQPTGIETLCQGDNISEYTTTSTNASSFQWRVAPTTAGEISGTGTTATIIWNNSYHGLARIYVSGYNGVCNSIESEPLEVMVNPKPESQTISGFGEVCPGSQSNPYSVSMVDGNSYLWTLTGGTIAQGQNTNSVRVNWGSETGTNGIEVKETVNATGCNKKHLKTVLVSGALAPPKPDIRVKGAIQILISSANASAYQWYVNNSPIENAVKKYYVPRGNAGEYSLQIIWGNCRTFSDPLVVPVDLSKTEVEKLMWAFPNPSKGLVYVELIGELNGLVHFRVLDIKGAEIYLKKAYKGEYYHIEALQIPNSQPGLYIIESRIGGMLVDYQKVVIE